MRNLWPKIGLWRHGDFLKLWSAETVSQFGTQVSLLAIPFVAVLVLDATTFQVAALGVVDFLPFMIFTLPAGVWVDRLRRRPILIAGDFGRAALLATIPIAYVLDVLTLGQLYVVGFLVGICTVFFDVAYQSYLPSLVEREQIIEGNSKLEISRSSAQIAGPGLRDCSSRRSRRRTPSRRRRELPRLRALLLQISRHEEPVAHASNGEKTSLWTELKEGLRFVLGNPNLRAQAGCTATSNFFSNVSFAIIIVFLVRELGLSAGVIGLVLSLGTLAR
jgi:Na+/melibiose symporter-like transporter